MGVEPKLPTSNSRRFRTLPFPSSSNWSQLESVPCLLALRFRSRMPASSIPGTELDRTFAHSIRLVGSRSVNAQRDSRIRVPSVAKRDDCAQGLLGISQRAVVEPAIFELSDCCVTLTFACNRWCFFSHFSRQSVCHEGRLR